MAETALLDPPAEQAPAPSGPSLADLAERVRKSDTAREEAGVAVEKRAESKMAALKPAVAASAAREKQIAETPAPPVPELTKPPSRALSEFLSPRENESPHASIMKLISAIGLLATGASGLVRGDARGSLAALTGALSGWHEGDKERADRQFADWQAATDNALKQHKLDVEGWQRWMEQGNLLEGQRMTGLKLKLAESEIPADAAIWKASSASEAVKELDAMLTHQANVQAQRDRIVDARTKATEDRESRDANAAALLQFRRDAEASSSDLKGRLIEMKADQERQTNELRRESLDLRREAQEETKRRNAEHAALAKEALELKREAAHGKAQAKHAAFTLLDQVEGLIPEMERKGFLSKSPDALSIQMAAAKRSKWNPLTGQPGDETLVAWMTHSGTMVAIQRQLGDIGPRAMAAYEGAVDLIKSATSSAGAKLALAQMREALESGTGTASPTKAASPAPAKAAGPSPAKGGWGKAEVVR